MRLPTRQLIAACLLGGFVASAVAGPPSQYSAEAISATVIDAETRQPLEGVIVVAHWQLFYSTVGGRVPGGQLEVLETVTDQDGKFSFPAWGPKKVPKYQPQEGDSWLAHIPFLAPDAFLDNLDPQLLLFKPGYEYRGLQNPSRSTTDHSTVRRSVWNGKRVEMKPFKGTAMEQFKVLMDFSRDMESFTVHHPEPCAWLQVPRTLKVMIRERVRLEGAGVAPTWDRTVDKQLLDGEGYFVSACGQSAMSALQELKDK